MVACEGSRTYSDAMESTLPGCDRSVYAWARGAAAGVLALAGGAVAVSLWTSQEPLFGLQWLVLPAVAIAAVLVVDFRRAVWAWIPPGQRLLWLAAIALPLFATATALWVPEALIGYSAAAVWSYRAGWEVSLTGPAAAGVIAAATARACGRRGATALGLALVALSMSLVGRDLGIRNSGTLGSPPDWCYREITRTADGVTIEGHPDRCTVILPGSRY